MHSFEKPSKALHRQSGQSTQKLEAMFLLKEMGFQKLSLAGFAWIQYSWSFVQFGKGSNFLSTKQSSKVTSHHVNGETECCVLAFVLPMHCLDVNTWGLFFTVGCTGVRWRLLLLGSLRLMHI